MFGTKHPCLISRSEDHQSYLLLTPSNTRRKESPNVRQNLRKVIVPPIRSDTNGMGLVTMSERDLKRIQVLTEVLAGRRTVVSAAAGVDARHFRP
jgi:hypothetical protein